MSKKLGESILVGSNIVVTLLSVRGGTVRVGVSAPEDIPIEHHPADRVQKPPPAAKPIDAVSSEDPAPAVKALNDVSPGNPARAVSTPAEEAIS